MSIKSIIEAYGTALNANDIDSILSLYSADPVFMPQGAPALIGRDAVRAGYTFVFNTLKLNVQFTIHEIEEVGDLAWVRTSSAGRTRVLAAGIETDEGNNELFVFRKENGEWRIHRYLFATNLSKS
ncbi:YybH family protein [Solimicrobium silvestre]|uniref:Ketosteroid isomerase-like protein n=1 Tax=Solimicrobium silvestre TaxID=2099400 RepID=A0A2S9H3M0_9BURK|nr:nuclear transport factor 2 family protein [Solimicrobium silvestre]PRC94584.1 Ketosteroid isomerase-like protein [Solimicrobium silvestre]